MDHFTFFEYIFYKIRRKTNKKKADEANKTTIYLFYPSTDINSPISLLRTHKMLIAKQLSGPKHLMIGKNIKLYKLFNTTIRK